MTRSGGQELFPGEMAYSVWICAQAMPQRGHDLWGGGGTGEGKEKGLEEARVMAPLRSELTGEFRPEHGRKEPQTWESVPLWEKPGPVTGSLGHLLTT